MPSIVQDFLEAAPPGTARVLQLLATAESLTDHSARAIYEMAPVHGLSADGFLGALHYADFIVPRNSEWHITSNVRREFQALSAADPEIISKAHRSLIDIAIKGDRSLAGTMIPAYLFTNAGRAYHLAALGQWEEALALYGSASAGPLTGAQWLASELATAQEESGVIPRGAIETTFLRAMVLFREQRWREAEPLFRRLAATDAPRREVAIAMHILGNLVSRRNGAEAERLYRRSIDIGEEIENRHHVAQTLHSLANLIGRDSRRRDEAEGLYRRSIDFLEDVGDRNGVAQTLHSLANLIGRDLRRRDEAEGLCRRSIDILEDVGDRNGVAQTLHSLANLIGRDSRRRDEAEGLYRRSIDIREDLEDKFGLAQTLHSLANLIGRDSRRRDEAEALYRRSIDILEDVGDRNGVAQTLRSLSFVVEHRSPLEAEQLLEQSLDLNQRQGNREGIRIVEQSLRQLRERYKL